MNDFACKDVQVKKAEKKVLQALGQVRISKIQYTVWPKKGLPIFFTVITS